MNESIETKIELIEADIAAAYDEAEAKGATMPAMENSANLADTVASIPEAVQPTLIPKQITANGTYAAEDEIPPADGYSEVEVDVPDESKDTLNSLIDRSITTITNDATSIGDYAFQNCKSLTKADFPEATFIGNIAFSGCKSLTEVNFPKVKSIKNNAFANCEALAEVNFPEVTSIGDYAFVVCTALTKADFPKVKSIGSSTFQNCKSLTEVNFPKVKSIGSGAFYGCKALTEVSFPNVTSIGNGAFSGCKSIQYFDMSEVARVPTIRSNTFDGTTCIFLFRDQTQLNEYASATNWSTLANRFQIKGATS